MGVTGGATERWRDGVTEGRRDGVTERRREAKATFVRYVFNDGGTHSLHPSFSPSVCRPRCNMSGDQTLLRLNGVVSCVVTVVVCLVVGIMGFQYGPQAFSY